ncbi:hypothetical protein D3C78_990680 [compost metagenome]
MGQFVEALFDLGQWQRAGVGQMGRRVLVQRSHIDDHHFAPARLLEQLLPAHGSEPVRIGNHLLQGQTQLRQMRLRHLTQGDPQSRHIGRSQPVDHVLAVPPGGDQMGLTQRLEVGAGESDVD